MAFLQRGTAPFLRGAKATGMPALRRVIGQLHTTSAARSTVAVEVNGKAVQVPPGITVFQACAAAGVDVPRFCYHERLSIAGNCRMCLVEVEKSPKPIASCAMPIMPGMKIRTDTPKVHKAREGVMEFLLANHPLDCPICDQGGECDLQDQSLKFGSDISRFREWKRTVEDKNLGPIVKTVMTCCIHCTRCVRFSAEVAGVPALGVTGRGTHMEIGTYVDRVFDSELSGNVVDLCPVGALTSKPFAFTSRPWELQHTESIDVMDALGSNIRIDTRGPEIMRILPRLHEQVNEEWISDKTRYAHDGLKRQRLDSPYFRKGNEFLPVKWEAAMVLIAKMFKAVPASSMQAVAGSLVDTEALVALKDLMNSIGCENLRSSQDTVLDADVRSHYLFNSSLYSVEDSDLVILVGTNPRMEAPIFNARLRKSVLHYGLKVANVGPAADLAVEKEPKQLGEDLAVLSQLASGKHAFSAQLAKANKPMLVVGMQAIKQGGRSTLRAVQELVAKYPKLQSPQWNGVNILHSAASRVGQLDIGFVAGASANTSAPAKLVYLLGVDDQAFLDTIPKDAFVIYQGHHGDLGAARANLILPGTAYTEKTGTYVNTEGRVQTTLSATNPVGQAREDWQILRAVSECIGKPLKYDTLAGVRARMVDIAPHLARHDVLESSSFSAPLRTEGVAELPSTPLSPLFDNFYMTDPISRNSRTMAKCTAQLPKSKNSYVQQHA